MANISRALKNDLSGIDSLILAFKILYDAISGKSNPVEVSSKERVIPNRILITDSPIKMYPLKELPANCKNCGSNSISFGKCDYCSTKYFECQKPNGILSTNIYEEFADGTKFLIK